MLSCECCKKSFCSMQSMDRHNTSKLHEIRSSSDVKKYTCDCGKSYLHLPSLRNHKLKCTFAREVVVVDTSDSRHSQQRISDTVDQLIDELKHDIDSQKMVFQKEREEQKLAFDKERQEMKLAFEETMKEQINKILEKHAGTTNNTTNNTSNIESQNINIIIKAFGNENTDYIDDKAILACIGRVYKSIPSLLEKIHFDPNHPENHNIKITNKKLPYASIMGDNRKWKTVDRKDAIEKMVLNSYNMLDDKYTENKEKFSTQKKENFEGFQSKFESDDKELMKQIKTEVDMMVLNGGG